ncbi:MAG: tetratricopeptide repeat protein [Deltaproteobacteria bacterium]|nr:tetratricopeptide repeat protein [Deltaproteobacteria bacterium]
MVDASACGEGDSSDTEVSYYQKAIQLCPDYFEAHNRLGDVYKVREDYESAIRAFKEAVKGGSFAEPHYNLGEIYRMQGRYDLAAQEFKTAITIKPDFRDAQNQLQYVQKRSGKSDAAIEALLGQVPSETRREPVSLEDRPGPVAIAARPGPDPIEARPGPVSMERHPMGVPVGARPGTIPNAIFTRIPGMTLPRGSFLFDIQYKYWRQQAGLELEDLEALGADSRETDVHVLIGGIRYGLTNNLTIGVIPKFFLKQVDLPITFPVTGPGRMVSGEGLDAELEVSGLGDTVFLTKYRFWHAGMTHLSAFLQVSVPTGDKDAEAKHKGIVRRIPLGSGSVDFAPGIALTTVKRKFTINSDIWYVFTDGRHGLILLKELCCIKHSWGSPRSLVRLGLVLPADPRSKKRHSRKKVGLLCFYHQVSSFF